jgi:phasin family protein
MDERLTGSEIVLPGFDRCRPDLNAILESYRQAFAPAIAAQQSGLKTLERLARYQFAVAGDYLDWSLAMAKAATTPKSTADLVSQQVNLNTSFAEKLRGRAEEFTQIATETQDTVAKFMDEAGAKVVETAKRAAENGKAAA